MRLCFASPRPRRAPSSTTSLSRTAEPLSKYSLLPSRKILRPSATSSNSIGIAPSRLSKNSVTDALPMRGVSADPFHIRSSPFLPRSIFIDCSPSTHQILSAILDLPEPLGPTTATIRDGNSKTVVFANDLNPEISNFLRYIPPMICLYSLHRQTP